MDSVVLMVILKSKNKQIKGKLRISSSVRDQRTKKQGNKGTAKKL